MIQHGIEKVLSAHPKIPVATVHSLSDVDVFYERLKKKGVTCIEITLRTDISWEAIDVFKKKYGAEFHVGVGTILSPEDVDKCAQLDVDFMVTPGCTPAIIRELERTEIPFLPGVSTPSEIIQGLNLGWQYFKFFPAHLFGGIQALKTYGATFGNATFCPTGGITDENADAFLALENVLSVGGSWLIK